MILTRVIPGMPDESLLILKLQDMQPPGFGERMPAGGAPPLDVVKINAIWQWIQDGALQ